jgi:hypothetical protein
MSGFVELADIALTARLDFLAICQGRRASDVLITPDIPSAS